MYSIKFASSVVPWCLEQLQNGTELPGNRSQVSDAGKRDCQEGRTLRYRQKKRQNENEG